MQAQLAECLPSKDRALVPYLAPNTPGMVAYNQRKSIRSLLSSSAIQGVWGQTELNESLFFKKLNRHIKSCLLNQEISPQGFLPVEIELQSPCSQRNTAPGIYHFKVKSNGSIPSVTGICYFQSQTTLWSCTEKFQITAQLLELILNTQNQGQDGEYL